MEYGYDTWQCGSSPGRPSAGAWLAYGCGRGGRESGGGLPRSGRAALWYPGSTRPAGRAHLSGSRHWPRPAATMSPGKAPRMWALAWMVCRTDSVSAALMSGSARVHVARGHHVPADEQLAEVGMARHPRVCYERGHVGQRVLQRACKLAGLAVGHLAVSVRVYYHADVLRHPGLRRRGVFGQTRDAAGARARRRTRIRRGRRPSR